MMTVIKFKPTTKELFKDSIIPIHMTSLFNSFLNESAGKFERNVFLLHELILEKQKKPLTYMFRFQD